MHVLPTRPILHLWNLGHTRYLPALRIQESIANSLKTAKETGNKSKQNVLLIVEHDPVYTTGIRTKVYSMEEEQALRALGADFVRTNRGGLITFHGHGQLVAYPVMDLADLAPREAARKALLGVKWYVCKLEQVVIDVCAELGLNATRSPHTGVWISDNKVCAMGVHSSGLVTSHGLALNCDTDLSWFSHIVPCGIVGKGVTSLSKELDRTVTVQDVIPRLVSHFESNFQCQIVESRPEIAEELESMKCDKVTS